jgi:hypothetical protein
MEPSLNSHWYPKGGVPHTLTLKEAVLFVAAMRLCGCDVIVGNPAGKFPRGLPAVGGSAAHCAGSLPCSVALAR